MKATLQIDFIGIGATKAASTWLWSNLRQHPDVWMPPAKELHYFDRSLRYPSPSFLASDRLGERLFGRQEHNRYFRSAFAKAVGKSVLRRDMNELRWYLKYFLGSYGDDWYQSLFEEAEGKILGEITPAYSILDSDDVKRIHDLFPELRVIFLIRNPIGRAWSSIRYTWQRGNLPEVADLTRIDSDMLGKIKRRLDEPHQVLRTSYLRTINIWHSHFPEEQFFIGFYDDVIRNPQNLLTEVLDFIGADSSIKVLNGETNKAVNVSHKVPMPPEIRRYLAQKYHRDLQQLGELVGGYAVNWLEEAEAIMDLPVESLQK